MPTVLDWNPTVDPSELTRRFQDTLAAGMAVVLPGDVGYVVVIGPESPHAGAVLDALAEVADEPPAVLAYGPDDAAALGLAVPTTARRLMLRGWPDSFTVALPLPAGFSLPARWEPAVCGRLATGGEIRFRSPAHPVQDAVFPALTAPAIVADTFHPTAATVAERLGERVGLVVSANELPTGPRPTLVRCDETGWTVTRPGTVGAGALARLAARIILFVCTGNTCRSPLAEALARKLLADRLGCPVDELPARGFWVLSGGTAAYGGSPAAEEAASVAAEHGGDLKAHQSRPVNPGVLAAADDVIVMTQGHAQALAAGFPGYGPPPRLLCAGDADLDDPIGAGLDVYRACARTILRHLERFIPEWIGP